MGLRSGTSSEHERFLEPGDVSVPWSTEALWHAAQGAFRSSLSQGLVRMAAARRSADRLAHQLGLLDDWFEELAATTCKGCPDPCCNHAKVWLDFQDLLFIHLHHEALPPHQLRRNLHERCRFLGLHGCRLPRSSRPWICTWYICPTQRQALERDVPGGWSRADGLRARIKSRRAAMEAAYLNGLGVSAAK